MWIALLFLLGTLTLYTYVCWSLTAGAVSRFPTSVLFCVANSSPEGHWYSLPRASPKSNSLEVSHVFSLLRSSFSIRVWAIRFRTFVNLTVPCQPLLLYLFYDCFMKVHLWLHHFERVLIWKCCKLIFRNPLWEKVVFYVIPIFLLQLLCFVYLNDEHVFSSCFHHSTK